MDWNSLQTNILSDKRNHQDIIRKNIYILTNKIKKYLKGINQR